MKPRFADPAVRPQTERFDLATLNEPQRQAVLHEGGPLLVLAGAGSGKTRTIIYRIARLIRDGVPAQRILGVTFTNKAAAEMRERLWSIAGGDGAKVRLSTFHSLAVAILKEELKAAGLKRGFCIYDTGDQLSLVRELMRQVRVADRRLDAARVLDLILRAKRERKAEIAIDTGDDYELAAFDLYPRYRAQLAAFNAVDFDDLLLLAEDVLDTPGPRERWSSRFDELLVDEYQDTSPDQLKLLKILAGSEKRVCVVGDDDQSIYAWRGADAKNILIFSNQFKGAREIVLDQNYRSTGFILAAANQVIKNNSGRKPKALWSDAGDGEPVDVVACTDPNDEAAFVVAQIQRLLADGEVKDEIAVLYRANVQSRIFEEELGVERIPFRVVGGQAFFERKEVKDALAYLTVAMNPRDEIALRRIINTPPRGIGPTSVLRLAAAGEASGRGLWSALKEAATVSDLPPQAVVGAAQLVGVVERSAPGLRRAKRGELSHLAGTLFQELGLRDHVLAADDAPGLAERRLENLDEVVRSLERFERSVAADVPILSEYLTSAALTNADEGEEEDQAGRVTLMTLHSAKGLEFRNVFLVGVEEELLPHQRTVDDAAGDLGEERRLFYVGMTRARRRLWLTHVKTRLKHGKPTPRTPSRFLQELPEGEGVRRRNRDDPKGDAESEKLAGDFFRNLRANLGIT
ncbi:MAG: UvrD-helicase domain-containing protein [Deltaproteobacteria bacterium]|nr:UvrD-helicase domain-containing protein [Deltaproteobacteria bacterium]